MPASKVEILLELNSKLDGINAGIARMDKMGKKATKLDKFMGGANRAVTRFGQAAKTSLLAAGVGLVAGGSVFAADSLNKYADFEAKMKGVEAVLKPTTKQFKALESEAKKLGRTTKFTARESASAIEVLAKNGVSTEKILGGVLENSLLLSASVGAELPDAADTLTDALAIFKLEAKDSRDVIDSINAVTINSKFAFEDYKAALASGGASAKAANQSIDDFNAAISATASFFDSGETAGTAYKVFIDRLVPSSDAAKAAQKKLGLQVFDNEGKIKDMADIAGQLQKGLAKLSDEERISALNKLFGTRGKNFAIALAQAGEEGLKSSRFLAQFADSSAQAEKRLEGTRGALTKFKSAFEGLQLLVGEPIADNVTPFIDALTSKMGEASEDGEWLKESIDSMFIGGIRFAAVFMDSLKNVLSVINAVSGGAKVIEISYLEATKAYHNLKALTSFGIISQAHSSAVVIQDKKILQAQKELEKLARREESLQNLPSSEEFIKSAEEILESARKIREANDILRDEERKFLDLQKVLQDATLKGAPSSELDTIKKLIEAQDAIIKKRREALNELKGISPKSADELSKIDTATSATELATKELAETAGVSMDDTIKAFERLNNLGGEELKGLEGKLDSVQRKLKETTKAGQKFEDEAVRNSWLKDFALDGTAFLVGLVDRGFSPLQDKLSTITKTGLAASTLATSAFASPVSQVAAGDSDAAGVASGLLSETEGIQARYAKDRAVILNEERLTAEQRSALIQRLDSQHRQKIRTANESEKAQELEKNQAKLGYASDFFGNLGSLMASENKTLFAIGKAAAIADATIQGILAVQRALAFIPPPFNFAVAGTIGVATAVNVAKIASQQPPGYFEGGLVGGSQASPASYDNRLIRAADGEFVVNNRATKANLSLLQSINSGNDPAASLNLPSPSSSTGGMTINLPFPPSQNATPAAPPQVNILFDSNDLMDQLEQSGRLDGAFESYLSRNGTRLGIGS
jgi:TP901 family phage tail tape measure protein